MKTQADKSSYFHRAGMAREILMPLIVGVAVILFSTAGFARMMGWGPMSGGDPVDGFALDQTATAPATSEAPARPRCAECGMIVSMREIENHDRDPAPRATGEATAGDGNEIRAKTARRYEITVRMAGGSIRVIDAANPARWRTGERLIVIAGVSPSDR